MSIMLTDPRDLMEFVSRVNAYTNEIYAGFRVSRTAHLADLYRKSDSDLIKELSEVENYYENLPLHTKIWRFFSPQLIDLREDVRDEITYRKEHTREPDDWKKLFKKTAEIFENKGLEKLAQYMRGKAIEDYYNSHVTKSNSAR